jgi:hypothetical protein
VFAFVRDAVAQVGDPHIVAAIFEAEADAGYGRGRRADAIQAHFQGIDTRGLDWKQGADVRPCAAMARALAAEKPTKPTVRQHQPERSSGRQGPARGGVTLGDMLAAKGKSLR